MSRDAMHIDVRDRILQTDIGLLNDNDVSDATMMVLAAEHAARVETLSKAVAPTAGRALLLMASRALLEAAKQIEAATFQEPELACV